MNKFKEFITKDFGWKLLSVGIATIMWVLVINVNQPIDTRTYYKKVTVENAHILSSQGLCLADIDEILDTTVTIKIKAQRTALDRLVNSSQSDITATIDASELQVSSPGENLSLPIEINFLGNASVSAYTVLSQSPSNLTIKLEELIEEEKYIDVDISGVVEEEGMLSTPQLNHTVSKVAGASSAVAEVEKVYGVIDGSKVKADGYETVSLKAVDSNGIEVKNVSISPSSVLVNFYEMMSKDIPVNIGTTGSPKYPYELGEMVLSPSYVKIIGEASLVEKVSSINLDSVSIANVTNSVSKRFSIKDYLPEGVFLATGQSQYIDVNIPITGNEVRKLSISSEQIDVLGEDSQKIYLLREFADVVIEDKKATLDKLDVSEIVGTIDVTGLSVGEYTLDIKFDMADTLSNVSGHINILIEEDLLILDENEDQENTNSDNNIENNVVEDDENSNEQEEILPPPLITLPDFNIGNENDDDVIDDTIIEETEDVFNQQDDEEEEIETENPQENQDELLENAENDNEEQANEENNSELENDNEEQDEIEE